MTAEASPFLGPALETVARVLGLCDRQAGSPTYGCCDRNHWHYRITDFTNARMQEAGLLLAAAYAAPLPGNRFKGQKTLLDWVRAIWRFWLSRRNGDGSTPEVYPYERSNCATSFTAASFVETVDLLGGAAQWSEELAEAEKSFEWLGVHSSPDVANQVAASLLALTGYAHLTGTSSSQAAARRRCDEFIGSVEPDGSFPEYGGFDAGYQSITLSTLSRVQRLSGTGTALDDAIRRGEIRLNSAIDDMGRTDPGKNARRTQFLYPYGLAARKSPALRRIEAGLQADAVLRPTWMDDRYCIAMATDYLLTAWELSNADDAR
jgi:hypothetical protein